MEQPTAILNCTCVSEFQDKRYGRNKRVFNHAPGGGAHPRRYRCATCLKEKIK